jgi:CheY-like chemotaxis protein
MPEAIRPTVLTVEDDPIVRADLRHLLEDAGFAVCADARDGVEAVVLARRHRPDVVLLDLGLPRIDGVEATRRIRRERDVPVVALTGRSRELVEQALAAGAASYVRKPFHEGELLDALMAALVAHAARALAAQRERSRRAIAAVLRSLGQPEAWAEELEERQFRAGRLWRQAE